MWNAGSWFYVCLLKKDFLGVCRPLQTQNHDLSASLESAEVQRDGTHPAGAVALLTA